MTQLPPPGDPDALYVIDISGYVFRAYHALPPLNAPSGEPTHASLGVTSMLMKLVEAQRPGMLAVAMDSRKKSFRHGLYDAYKANRPPAPEDLKVQMGRVREIVERYGIPVLQQEGFEADDVIATSVRLAREQGMRVVIVSADKDLLQLVGDDVCMYDTGRDKVFGVDETIAKLGVPPAQVRDYLALVGDSSDNVPGVPSVGPKTAIGLLEAYGSLEGVYAHVDEVAKKGVRGKLKDNHDKALLSQELVSLRDDVDVVIEREALRPGGADLPGLHALFDELGFTRLKDRLPALSGAEGGADAPGKDSPAGGAQGTQGENAPDGPVLGQPVQLVVDADALAELAAGVRAAGACSLYFVTDAPRVLHEPPVGLAVGYGSTVAYVPISHSYLGCPSQLQAAAVAEGLSGVMADPALPKRCEDAKRSLHAATALGLQLAGVAEDLLLESYLLDADGGSHSPGAVCATAFGTALAAQDVLQPKRRGKKDALPSTLEVEPTAQHAGDMVRAIDAGCAHVRTRLEQGDGAGWRLLQTMELPLSRVLAGMERSGVSVDTTLLKQLAQQAAELLVQLEARCTELAGHDFNVNSPRQLEKILFDELELPVVKKTKTARSTDHDVLEELSVQHELPAAILEHRMLAKLKNTYLDALPREVHPRTGRIHTDFRQAVAATGRLSSSDPNLQNIPIRTELGRRVRDAFVPRAGWALLSADYSQIELRVLAHLSADPVLVEAFREGKDVHRRTARALFDVDDEGVTREMRAQAKTVNFAVIYGQTQFALARNLRIERAEAGRYIKAFFAQYAGVNRYLDGVVESAREAGHVTTLCGRQRHLPELRSSNRMRRQAAERVARNTPIQGTAADIMKFAMLAVDGRMRDAGLEASMLLTVHDELVFEAPPSEREALESLVRDAMQGALALDVPLLVESGWGGHWGEAH